MRDLLFFSSWVQKQLIDPFPPQYCHGQQLSKLHFPKRKKKKKKPSTDSNIVHVHQPLGQSTVDCGTLLISWQVSHCCLLRGRGREARKQEVQHCANAPVELIWCSCQCVYTAPTFLPPYTSHSLLGGQPRTAAPQSCTGQTLSHSLMTSLLEIIVVAIFINCKFVSIFVKES